MLICSDQVLYLWRNCICFCL